MDKKNHNGILIFLIILTFCFLIFVTYIKLTYNNSSNNTNNNQSSGNNEVEIETLDTHSEFVQQLHNMVDIFDISIGTSKKYLGYYYLKDSYNVNNIDNEVKIALGINQVRNGVTSNTNDIGKPVTINETDVVSGIKKVFGDSVTYQDTNLTDMIDCMLFNYDSTSNTYKGTWDGCGGVLLSSVESKVIKAVKIGDKIEITEKMAYFSYDESTQTYDVYSDAAGINLVANKFKYVKVLDTETDLLDSVISYYGSLLKLYKYTFILGSDGNYHFTSVELIK